MRKGDTRYEDVKSNKKENSQSKSKSEDTFGRKIDTLKEKKRQKQRKKQRPKAKREKKWEAFWEKEADKMDEKYSLTKEIFAWAEKFVHSNEYEELCTLIRESTASLLFAGGLWIYTGDWGHKMRGGHGCWSRLYVTDKGTFNYGPGYKWMGRVEESLHFDTPEAMAKQLTLQYIEKLHDFIFSGNVQESLIEKLESSIS